MAKLQAQEAILKKSNASLEGELATEKFLRAVVEAEVEFGLKQMKTLVVDMTLHAWAELMEEFKAGHHDEWDPDYEIVVWKEREAEVVQVHRRGKKGPPTLGARARHKLWLKKRPM